MTLHTRIALQLLSWHSARSGNALIQAASLSRFSQYSKNHPWPSTKNAALFRNLDLSLFKPGQNAKLEGDLPSSWEALAQLQILDLSNQDIAGKSQSIMAKMPIFVYRR